MLRRRVPEHIHSFEDFKPDFVAARHEDTGAGARRVFYRVSFRPRRAPRCGHGIPFWDRCTTHFRTYFSGDWDVHWGYDLGFDPRHVATTHLEGFSAQAVHGPMRQRLL